MADHGNDSPKIIFVEGKRSAYDNRRERHQGLGKPGKEGRAGVELLLYDGYFHCMKLCLGTADSKSDVLQVYAGAREMCVSVIQLLWF